jgi:hypothetical protein
MTTAHERESPRIGESLTWQETTARWFGILGPLGAAFMQQQLSYGFTTWACTKSAVVLVHLPAVLALLITALAASISRREYRERTNHSKDDRGRETSSADFFGAAGLLASALALALIVAQWLPTVFIDPCQR